MAKVKYNGFSDVYKFSKEDFERVGVDDQDEVTFDKSNDHTVDVSDKAAEYLKEKELGFFDADSDEAKGNPVPAGAAKVDVEPGGSTVGAVGSTTAAGGSGSDASTGGGSATAAGGSAGGPNLQ